jgi:hypothetical protein
MISGTATTETRPKTVELARFASPMWVLSAMVVASAAVRALVALRHALPRYFPDEYVYQSLSRSISHGHLSVHSRPAHFPALLEPILAAPIWRLFPITTAYHLVQLENAVIGSLVVVPVYFLARELRLPRGYSYLCCLYAVALPAFVATAFIVTDFVAYPLALGSVLMGVRALTRPSWRRQLLFLGLAALTVFARTQYFVFVPAYLVAAAVVDGRRMPRKHLFTIAAIAPAVGVALVGALGYYNIGRNSFDPAIATWIPLEGFLLAVAAGVVIVPGAIAGIIRPGDRTRASFGALAAAFALMLMAEVAVIGAQEGQFRERYLFAILPLVAVAFGIYLERRRPHGWVVLGVSVALAVAAARLPLANYATNAKLSDSQTLLAADWLQDHWSAGSSSLFYALLFTFGAAAACLGALRKGTAYVAVPAVLLAMAATTVVATKYDRERDAANRPFFPKDLSWIDHTVPGGEVTAIATPGGQFVSLLEELFWNPRVTREVVAPDAIGSDPYAREPLIVGHDGTLTNVGRYFLFDLSGSAATFANATLLGSHQTYRLYRAEAGGARVRTYVGGLLVIGWSMPDGVINAFPTPSRRATIALTLSLPSALRRTQHVRIGALRFSLRPGQAKRVECTAGSRAVHVTYSIRPARPSSLGVPVGVQMSKIRGGDAGPAVARPPSHDACRLVG